MKPCIKLPHLILAALLITLGSFNTHAGKEGDGHSHGHKHVPVKDPGPNGGRVVKGDGFSLEFLVKKDRNIQITFLNEDLKPTAPSGQSVSMVGGSRSNPTRLSFAKQGDVLVSDKAWPPVNNLPAILQIKATESSPTVRERFNINFSTCSSCSLQEYACICGHEDQTEADHKH